MDLVFANQPTVNSEEDNKKHIVFLSYFLGFFGIDDSIRTRCEIQFSNCEGFEGPMDLGKYGFSSD